MAVIESSVPVTAAVVARHESMTGLDVVAKWEFLTPEDAPVEEPKIVTHQFNHPLNAMHQSTQNMASKKPSIGCNSLGNSTKWLHQKSHHQEEKMHEEIFPTRMAKFLIVLRRSKSLVVLMRILLSTMG